MKYELAGPQVFRVMDQNTILQIQNEQAIQIAKIFVQEIMSTQSQLREKEKAIEDVIQKLKDEGFKIEENKAGQKKDYNLDQGATGFDDDEEMD